MKLSQIKKDEIAKNILSIYDKPQEEITKLEQEIVKDNYLAWIPQYEEAISKLPEYMVQRDTSIQMDVPKADGSTEFTDRWFASFPQKVAVIKSDNSYYGAADSIPIMDVVYDRIIELQTKSKELSSEKRSLKTFVDECLAKVTTTKQLRDLWEDYPALSQHIPPEPARKSKTAQQLDLEIGSELQVDALNRRLTMNILEG